MYLTRNIPLFAKGIGLLVTQQYVSMEKKGLIIHHLFLLALTKLNSVASCSSKANFTSSSLMLQQEMFFQMSYQHLMLKITLVIVMVAGLTKLCIRNLTLLNHGVPRKTCFCYIFDFVNLMKTVRNNWITEKTQELEFVKNDIKRVAIV